MRELADRSQGSPVLLLSAAVDRLFLELLKYEGVMDIDPAVLKMVQEAAEAVSGTIADINLIGGEE